jgi:PDZ domain-containing protein
VRELLRPSRILSVLLLAAVVTFAVLWIVPSDQFLLEPDPAHEVATHVFVPDAKPDANGGGIYFVDVTVRRAKLFESLFPWVHSGLIPRVVSGITLVPASQFNPPGASDKARRAQDIRDMTRSQSIAAAVALRAAGYKVVARPTGVLVSFVDPNGPAARALEPTDVIVAVDGRPVRTPLQLRRVMKRHRPGDLARFTFHRGKELRVVTLKTVVDPRDSTRAIVGILVTQAADIKLPLAIRVDVPGVGGPSAGLAFALEVLQKLGRDVDHGLRIAATGEIELDGSVGAIGGIKQKTIGARKAHVDVFLVPGENAGEARRYAHGLRILAVDSFPQALRELATLSHKP